MQLLKLVFTSVLLMFAFSQASFAGDAEITLKRGTAQPAATPSRMQPAPARVAPAPHRAGPTVQQMLMKLRPRPTMAVPAAAGGMGVQAKPQEPPKYEVADCTGSDGKPKVCCSFTPGGGGSSCDVFIALCDSMSGTSSTGGSNGATCSGDGVLE